MQAEIHVLDFGAPPQIPLNDLESLERVLRQGKGVLCVVDVRGLLIRVTESYDALKVCLDLLEEGRLQSTPI